MHYLLKMSRHQVRQLAAEKIAARRAEALRRDTLNRENTELYRQMAEAFGYQSEDAALACLRLSPGGFHAPPILFNCRCSLMDQLRRLCKSDYPIIEIKPGVFKIVK